MSRIQNLWYAIVILIVGLLGSAHQLHAQSITFTSDGWPGEVTSVIVTFNGDTILNVGGIQLWPNGETNTDYVYYISNYGAGTYSVFVNDTYGDGGTGVTVDAGLFDCSGECSGSVSGSGSTFNFTLTVGPGCLDETACNYIFGSADDGSCLVPADGQDCCPAGLFFSEFSEGAANDTYFELFNASPDTIRLENFLVARTANQLNPAGGFDFEDIVFSQPSQDLAPGGTYIVAEAGASPDILALADTVFPEISSGDDALGLIRILDSLVVDQIGIPGTDEGLGWTVAGTPDATYNRTIIRKPNVSDGNGGDWSSSAGLDTASSEWMALSGAIIDDAGQHAHDGACIGESPYLIRGCTNPLSCIYHPDANAHVETMCDFTSCYGCMESAACNYDPEAEFQGAGDCAYPEDLYGAAYVDCAGICLNDQDLDGVCDEDEPVGCIQPDACNFDALAEFDDGSCEYETCAGCTDPEACNFDPEATFNVDCDYACVTGCTTEGACNYNPANIVDDGSCDYACVTGCTDPFACNYGSLNIFEDGSCEFTSCLGCTDPDACNFSASAIYDDGSCSYGSDADENGICDEDEGCTNPLAANYNPNVTVDDGSCCGFGTDVGGYGIEVEVIAEDIGILVGASGEIDLVGYDAYRVYITMENETDFLSSIGGDTFNPTLITSTTDFYQDPLGGATPNGINPLLFPVYPGLEFDSWVTIGLEQTADAGAGEANVSLVQNFSNPWANNFENGGGVIIDDEIGGAWYVLNGDANGVAGSDLRVLCGQFTTSGELSVQLLTQIFIEGAGENQVEVNGELPTFIWPSSGVQGCTDESACNFDETVCADNGSCVYPEPFLDCLGECINDADADGICDEFESVGCTDPTACNYNANATDDDGTCEYTSCVGCTDDAACNYDETATVDDGSCDYPEAFEDCSGNCFNDININGICDELETFGCTDVVACNYNAIADAEDGSCIYPVADYLDCDGNCINDFDGNGLCDEEEACGDPEACNYDPSAAVFEADYCLIVDTVQVHTAGELAGMTTYRYYVKCANPADFVSSVSGDINNPTVVTTTTDFYQDELGGPTPNNLNESLYATFPNLEYDSWVTIGLSSAPDFTVGESNVSVLQSTENPWYTNFEPGFGTTGGDIVINDVVGGMWYALNGDANGIAANHPANQVLIAQLTTDGEVEGNFYVQVYENGNGSNSLFFDFNIGDACIAPDEDCLYADDIYGVGYVDCDGNCLNDSDADGVCDADEVPGCTDAAALNYDPAATDDDGLCEYPAASVFDIIADSEDHTVLEDLIVFANLDGTLTDYGPWTVFAPTDAAWGALPDAVINFVLNNPDVLAAVLTYHVTGGSVTSEMLSDGQMIGMLNGDMATISIGEDGVFINNAEIIIADLIAENGVVHVIDAVIVPSIQGCTSLVSCNYNPLASIDDGSCETESCSGCLNETACNYDSTATISDSPSCTFPIDLYGADYYDCFGNCVNDADGDGICDEAEIPGCIYADACNYNPDATEDDGSCDYQSCAGCTDPAGCNYDATATIDEECQFPVDLYGNPNVDCDGNCLNDADGDAVCDEDEIPGCLDPGSCNYMPEATDYDVDLCDYVSCAGCTDAQAVNFDPEATLDDGSCDYCAIVLEAPVVTAASCFGGEDGSIEVASWSGANGEVQFILDGQPAQAEGTFDSLMAGTYQVLVVDELQCVDSATVVVEQPPIIEANIEWVAPLCAGASDGQLAVSPLGGGTGSLTVIIDGEVYDSIDWSVPAGVYEVVLQDELGCEVGFDVEVTEPDSVLLDLASIAPDCFGGVGHVLASAQGGTGTFEYAISPEADTVEPGQYEVVAGTYAVEAMDENGCSASGVIEVTEPDALTLEVTGVTEAHPLLAGGAVTLSPDGGTGNYGYQWSGEGFYSNESDPSLLPGTYDVLVTDANGCTSALVGIEVPVAILPGCTNEDALNFDPGATVPDGSCLYEGCSELVFAGDLSDVQPGTVDVFVGEELNRELALFSGEQIEDPASGTLFSLLTMVVDSAQGLPEGLTLDVGAASLSAGQVSCLTLSGLVVESGAFDVQVWTTVTASVFGQPFDVGSVAVTFELIVEDNPFDIPGCTYPAASNFNLLATVEDGSCSFPGCTDSVALNYDAFATSDNGGCIYLDDVTGNDCIADLDGSGYIGSADLLIFLGFYELICE